MKLSWQKWWRVSVIAAAILLTKEAVVQAYNWQTWNITGNILQYGKMTTSYTTDTSKYHAEFWWKNQWLYYQKDDANYLMPTGTAWALAPELISDGWSLCDLVGTTGVIPIWNCKQDLTTKKKLTYTLRADQWNFVNLSLAATITPHTSTTGTTLVSDDINIPVMQVDVCGTPAYFYLSYTGVRSEQSYQVPNPGNCDRGHDKIEISFVEDNVGRDDYFFNVKLRAVQVRGNPRFGDNLIARFVNHEGQKFMYKEHLSTVHAPTGTAYYPHAINDNVIKSDHIFGYALDDEDIAVGEFALVTDTTYRGGYAYAPQIQNISVENDNSLSVQIKHLPTNPTDKRRAYVMGVAGSAQIFYQSWDKTIQIWESGRDNYHGIRDDFFTRQWEVVNFVLSAEVNLEDGFYMMVRALDYYDDFGAGSDIYYCRGAACQKVDSSDERPAYLSRIFLGNYEHEQPYIRVQLVAENAEMSGLLDRLIVTEGQEEGTKLSAGIIERDELGNALSVKLMWPDLTRGGAHIRLRDTQTNEIIDEIKYADVGKIDDEVLPLSLYRLKRTYQWKENYVND